MDPKPPSNAPSTSIVCADATFVIGFGGSAQNVTVHKRAFAVRLGIAAQEEALLASADEPLSAEDFDRLLVGALPFGVGRGGHAGLRGSRMCDGRGA